MKGLNLSPENESEEEGFVYFESSLIPFGNNSIEISVISDFEQFEPLFVSQAVVFIKRIMFLGTTVGGGGDCVKVSEGWFAPKLSVTPTKCPVGQESNEQRSGCTPCKEGYFNPVAGSLCRKCPQFTVSSMNKSACEVFDVIQVNSSVF